MLDLGFSVGPAAKMPSAMRRSLLLLAPALAALLIAAACGGWQADAGAQPPDVVVVLIDTLRPDHLDLYGHPRETAPFLARLGKGSAVFRRAYSTSSWTAPATASLFTSVYPTQHGVTLGFFASRRQRRRVGQEGSARMPINSIASSLETLPERFRAAGYETFGLAANVNIGPEIGFSRGFDRFERLHEARGASGGAPAKEIEGRLYSWEEEIRAADRAFVYLHFNDVHSPYEKHAPWYEPHEDELADLQAAYDSEIRFVDEVLRRVFERFGWDEDTIVAVLSDHGEEFKEHGRLSHRFSLYRELVRILMLVRGPTVQARSVELNTSILDLMPTLLELAGLEVSEGFEGTSLAPVLVSGDPQGDRLRRELGSRTLFAHRTHSNGRDVLRAAIEGDLYLIAGPDGAELYDVARDPLQSRDLASFASTDLARLQGRLDAFDALEPSSGSRREGVVLNREAVEELETLGYVN